MSLSHITDQSRCILFGPLCNRYPFALTLTLPKTNHELKLDSMSKCPIWKSQTISICFPPVKKSFPGLGPCEVVGNINAEGILSPVQKSDCSFVLPLKLVYWSTQGRPQGCLLRGGGGAKLPKCLACMLPFSYIEYYNGVGVLSCHI